MVAFARGTHTELSKITEHCLCILSLALYALIHSVLQRVLKRMKLNDTESRKIDQSKVDPPPQNTPPPTHTQTQN